MLPALYVAELLFVATGAGLAAILHPYILPLGRAGRFALGFALAPFLTGALILAVISAWPGVPSLILALVPGVFGVALIICSLLRARRFPFLRCGTNRLRNPVFVVQFTGLLIIAALIACRIIYYVQQPTGNSDSLQYLQEAKHLASVRDFFILSGIEGLADGSLRGDPHGPLWIAYLGSALVWAQATGAASGEVLVRIPFQATLTFFFVAVVAFASALKPKPVIFVALLACLAIPSLFGASIGGDRDAFRLSALLLLAAFLLAHLRPGLRRACTPLTLVVAAALAAFAVQGHGLSLIVVPLLIVIWAIIALMARLPLRRILLVCGAMAIGFAIGAAHVIGAYHATGSVIGDNVAAEQQVQGTVYEQAVQTRHEARIGNGNKIINRIGITLGRDYGWPSVIALGVFVLGSIFLMRRVMSGPSLRIAEWRIVLVGVWFFGNSLFLLGVFDAGTMRFGAWTVLNQRYAMQWYLFAALLAAWGIARILSFLLVRGYARERNLVIFLLAALTLGTSLLIIKAWRIYPTPAYRVMADRLNAVARELSPSCHILSEDTGVNFYSEKPVVQLYSKQQRELLQASDAKTLDDLLKKRDFCIVVLYTGLYIDLAGNNAPLMRLLQSPAFRREDALPWRFYIRSDLAGE
jgi:hypothetical protein